ncbi:hypothetical protein MKZ38_004662 [Zalerion maritima]|uniref:Uncharacterized protein n=1 Tax=Zalerion maritima TaxID=339359 RepID=A0AAD5WRH1_9PEZI|nr:hypothetical protein MKZ38_004662 [Zalerion maritima]
MATGIEILGGVVAAAELVFCALKGINSLRDTIHDLPGKMRDRKVQLDQLADTVELLQGSGGLVGNKHVQSVLKSMNDNVETISALLPDEMMKPYFGQHRSGRRQATATPRFKRTVSGYNEVAMPPAAPAVTSPSPATSSTSSDQKAHPTMHGQTDSVKNIKMGEDSRLVNIYDDRGNASAHSRAATVEDVDMMKRGAALFNRITTTSPTGKEGLFGFPAPKPTSAQPPAP